MVASELFTTLAAEALRYDNADNMTEEEILEQYRKELSKITGKVEIENHHLTKPLTSKPTKTTTFPLQHRVEPS